LVIIPVLSGIIYLWLLQAPFAVEPRYMLPVYPAMLVIAALGLVRTVEQARQWYGAVTRRNSQPPGFKWIALPLFNLALIVVLINLVNSETYENTYSLQLSASNDTFATLDLPYYQQYLPQFINSLEKMKGLPEAAQPANRARLDTGLARAYLRARDYPKAMEAANTAITANPASFEAYHWRSRVWEELGQPAKAQSDEAKFKQLAPENLLVIGNLRF
jgi:tetratricopeptide (TPR) repeat protein